MWDRSHRPRSGRAANIRRRIILPFAADEFRITSVTDRGEVWGPPFDRLTATAARQGDLVILEPGTRDHESAYAAANKTIIDEAKALAMQLRKDRIDWLQ